MNKTVVINIVGLTRSAIGDQTPNLSRWVGNGYLSCIKPVLPAVTCAAQATYLTGVYPSAHGIVGNGWYFDEECEIKFWRQSNKLIQHQKIWEDLKTQNQDFTVSNMFWWYNMYSSADFSVTPRPQYLADGRKFPDVYSHPSTLRDALQKELGTFPLFNFWGPKTSIKSSSWIAEASILVDQWHNPTLTLIYLPHLDYNYQRYGTAHPAISNDLQEIDQVFERLRKYYEDQGAQIIVLSEYGITDVVQPIHLNRIFREKGWLAIRKERGLELLDAGTSQVFAVADHQIAHVYVQNKGLLNQVRSVLEEVSGVELVLDREAQEDYHINHHRSGELVAVADEKSWFTYYYWLDNKCAPDFARTVDIHRKPGYDPVEMFVNPAIRFPLAKAGWNLVKKKMGFRMLMDLIPLDATLIKGSHGRIPHDKDDWPVVISGRKVSEGELSPTEIYQLIKAHVLPIEEGANS